MDYKKILKDKIEKSPKGWLAWLKGQKNILKEINKNTMNIKLSEKVFWYINDMTDYPKCVICGKPVKKYYSMKHGYMKHCGCSCAQLDPETQKKLEETNLKIYGCKNPSQSTIVQNKVKLTCLKKYGATNIFGSKDGIKKIRKTWLKKYGCTNPMQSKEIQTKAKNTIIEKYGVTCGFHNHGKLHTSKGEQELFEFIKLIKNDARHNDRKQIWPMELDIYIPSLKLGIEYDGTYWHNLENMKLRDQKKDNICKDKGIKLLRVTEDDWIKNNDQIKKIILEILNG